MGENKRNSVRISPKSLIVELDGKEVHLLNISLGGAKFKCNLTKGLEDHMLILLLDPTHVVEVFFTERECKDNVFRVTFTKMSAHAQSLLAKYIMNWQSKRAYLAKKSLDVCEV